jgi:hypothetical protein
VAKLPSSNRLASSASPPTSAVARIVVALGLEDLVALDGAELADRAIHRTDEIGGRPAVVHPSFSGRVKNSLKLA